MKNEVRPEPKNGYETRLEVKERTGRQERVNQLPQKGARGSPEPIIEAINEPEREKRSRSAAVPALSPKDLIKKLKALRSRVGAGGAPWLREARGKIERRKNR